MGSYMDKGSELLQRMHRNWDEIYTKLKLNEIPWHSEKPDMEFMELIESNKVKPEKVLDVGCGAGTDALYLASKRCDVTAVDKSFEAIRIAKERAKRSDVKVNFIADDFMKIQFGMEVFDFINDRGCFHHMNHNKREPYAAKINDVLKPNGFYYLRCWSDKMEETNRGPYRITKNEIKRTFSQYFNLGEINDFRFGGKGARGYVCLMKKDGE
jgi:SAM-dependent methyltransferase